MLDRLEIEEWDWLLIGDGSGSNWDHQCGWATVSIDRLTFERLVWYGAMNRGTVNFAEMLAYLQPLNWYAAQEEKKRREARKNRENRRRFRNIHIVTDSEYCKNQGESGNLMTKRNSALWRIFDSFSRQGLLLHWHWIPRDDVELNTYVDKISKEARLAVKRTDIQQTVENNGRIEIKTVYDYNPN